VVKRRNENAAQNGDESERAFAVPQAPGKAPGNVMAGVSAKCLKEWWVM